MITAVLGAGLVTAPQVGAAPDGLEEWRTGLVTRSEALNRLGAKDYTRNAAGGDFAPPVTASGPPAAEDEFAWAEVALGAGLTLALLTLLATATVVLRRASSATS